MTSLIMAILRSSDMTSSEPAGLGLVDTHLYAISMMRLALDLLSEEHEDEGELSRPTSFWLDTTRKWLDSMERALLAGDLGRAEVFRRLLCDDQCTYPE
jgi:hypothetical protein